jgi:hypothetical protein
VAQDVATHDAWPALPLAEWRDTCATLHMWTQIVGKTRLALAPWQNHWWQVTLHVTARGLAAAPMPYRAGTLDAEFDFVAHQLVLRTSAGGMERIPLRPQSVAEFYRIYLAALERLEVEVHLWPVPVEVESPIRFTDDHQHASYDPEYANRFWRILIQADDVFRRFRATFLGKCSPVHFFWGSFDLAVTRFSGRRAPERPSADRVTREAYSHEVFSAGFWPGSGPVQDAAFYAYAAPEPNGFRDAVLQSREAYYQPQFANFILPYAVVRAAPSPVDMLLAFLQSAYDAAADLAQWDRDALERLPTW